MTRARVLSVLVLSLVAFTAYVAWTIWQVQGDLRQAESSIRSVQAGLESGDTGARDRAVTQLQDVAASADGHTSGVAWRAISSLPWVGDDARGIASLSEALDVVARDGVEPALTVYDGADDVFGGGEVDLGGLERLQRPLAAAAGAFTRAEGLTAAIDSSGFVGVLRGPVDRVGTDLADAAAGLRAASLAADVVPAMAGGDGPRDYLLVLLDNAEVRATGGLPRAWAVLHAEDGRLSLTRRGSARAFPRLDESVLPLTGAERSLYGPALGRDFAGAASTPDFPRAAALLDAHWRRTSPQTPLDGVIALDVVSLSYLLEGTGPVQVQDRTLDSGNVVPLLLDEASVDLSSRSREALLGAAVEGVIEDATGDVRSPLELLAGLRRAGSEGRFLLAPFIGADLRALAGARVLGELSGLDGHVPHVDVGLEEVSAGATSSSLRYGVDVRAVSCRGDRQDLAASLRLRQLSGAGRATRVAIRVYGPAGGRVRGLRLDGKAIGDARQVRTAGSLRPAVSVEVDVPGSRRGARLSWTMLTGEGQDADGEVRVTPGASPGDQSSEFGSAC